MRNAIRYCKIYFKEIPIKYLYQSQYTQFIPTGRPSIEIDSVLVHSSVYFYFVREKSYNSFFFFFISFSFYLLLLLLMHAKNDE